MRLLALSLWRRYREFVNIWLFSDTRRITATLTTLLLAALFMVFLSANARVALLGSDRLALSVLAGSFTAFTILVASVTLGRALNDLFLAKDFDLIASAPLKLSQVLVSRIGEITVQNLPLALVFTLPPLLALAPRAAKPGFLWLGLGFVVLQVAVITALSAVGLLLLTRLVPAGLLKQVIYVAWTVAFLGLYVWTNLELQNEQGFSLARTYAHLADSGVGAASGWAMRGLTGAFYGSRLAALGYLVLMAGVSSLAVYISATVLGSNIYAGRIALAEPGVRIQPRHAAWLFSIVPAEYRGIAEKEFLTFGRDVRELAGILYAFTLVALLAWRMNALGATLSFAVLPTAFFAGNLQIRTSLPAFGREGKQWLLLKAAPLTPRRLLIAKFIPWAMLSGLSSLALGFSLALLARLPWLQVALCAVLGALIALICVVTSLYLGARYADFAAERPEEYVLSAGRWGTLLLTLAIALVSWLALLPARLLASPLGYGLTVMLMGGVCALAFITMGRATERILAQALHGE